MKKIVFLIVLLVCLVAISVAVRTKDVNAHRTDTPHLDHYGCYVDGADLLCKIYVHNPEWWGSWCPHTVDAHYAGGTLRRFLKFGSAQGCNLWAYFRPIPPQRAWFATLTLRNWWDDSVVSTHSLSWYEPPPRPTLTPTSPPTPTPQPTSTPIMEDPYFTGYECDHWPAGTNCTAWMYVPESFTPTYVGTVESDYFIWGGTDWDPYTRIWTLTMFFEPVPCSPPPFARLYAVETPSGRLLDELYLSYDCESIHQSTPIPPIPPPLPPPPGQ